MKIALPAIAITTLLMSVIHAGPIAAQNTEQSTAAAAAVQATVDRLFDAMRAKDAAALRTLFLPEARLDTSDVDAWVQQVSGSSAYLDEVTYDEIIVVDQDLAMAWTPYTLYVNEVLHHCGVDAFILRMTEGEWKILQLNDTRRKESCPDPRS
ncbi:MAG: hypothetical protein Cons2KO_04190 [Congregibacter sp.]